MTGEDVAAATRSPAPAIEVDAGGRDFDAFYRAEMPRLVVLARALSSSAHADDLAQEAMLAAYGQWDRISRYDSPAAWVRRVCMNKASSAARRRATEARTLLRLNPPTATVPTLSEGAATVIDALRRLPRRQAQALALYYVYGESVADIAAVLQCSEGSVKTHLHRGRAALSRTLDDGGAA